MLIMLCIVDEDAPGSKVDDPECSPVTMNDKINEDDGACPHNHVWA